MSTRAGKRIAVALAVLAMLSIGLIAAFDPILHALGGASRHAPADLDRVLSKDARVLVDTTMADLDPALLIDDHVHLVGIGAGGTGCRVNARMLTFAHPKSHVQFLVYRDAARITDLARGDQEYAARLISLVRGIPRHGRYALLAFDAHYTPDGMLDEGATEMSTPSDYVIALSQEHPDLFVPVMSVHPYRADAAAEVERLARAGVKWMKWLPNAQGIDPADSRCDAIYERMSHWGITLLSHAGAEHAVNSENAQEFGNPLRLRRALEHGVKVVVAHCASLGESEDLDDPARKPADNFDLFLRLMGDPRWKGLLFGEISAITQINRCERPLMTLLERTDLHERLVNGSDYPLPAINVLFSTRKLTRLGYITEHERELLNEIYDVNPLLFDLATKRALKHPRTSTRFPPSVFLSRPEIRF